MKKHRFLVECQCSVCGGKALVHKNAFIEDPNGKPVCDTCSNKVYEELDRQMLEFDRDFTLFTSSNGTL